MKKTYRGKKDKAILLEDCDTSQIWMYQEHVQYYKRSCYKSSSGYSTGVYLWDAGKVVKSGLLQSVCRDVDAHESVTQGKFNILQLFDRCKFLLQLLNIF